MSISFLVTLYNSSNFSILESHLLLYSPYSLQCQCVEFHGFSFQPSASSPCTLNNNIRLFEIPWSRLLGLLCASFHFVSLSYVFLHSLFFIYIHPLPSFIHVIDHFLCNPWLSWFPVYSLNQITLSIWHSLFILFLCTSSFPLSHPVAPGFSSRVSCTFFLSAYNFCRSHLCLPFFELYDFLQTRADLRNHRVVVKVSISSKHCRHTLHTLSESMLHKYVFQLVSNSIFWFFLGLQCSLRLLKPCVGDDKSTPIT